MNFERDAEVNGQTVLPWRKTKFSYTKVFKILKHDLEIYNIL